jgi:thiol-disulfide isomerase/thioredoxin
MRYLIISFLFIPWLLTAAWAQPKNAISTGYPFPELQLPVPDSAQQRSYLGLEDTTDRFFSPSAINGKIVLVEFLNVHCPHCKDQAPIYNTLYRRIEKNPQLKDDVRMIGIAVGNTRPKIANFVAYYDVLFPIFSDENFFFWREAGGKTTPFTVYVRQNQPGKHGVVAATHIGTNHEVEKTLQLLSEIINESPEDLLLPQEDLVDISAHTPVPFSEEKIITTVRRLFSRQGEIVSLDKIKGLPDHVLFRGTVQHGAVQKQYYAEVVSRSTVCDICHDVHFVYLFDGAAKIIDIEALQLTKYGNQEFDRQDMNQLKTILQRRLLTQTNSFEPDVDAVSSATITSAVISEALNRTPGMIQWLEKNGLFPPQEETN